MKTAYGCSACKEGYDIRFSFDKIRERANGKPLTKDIDELGLIVFLFNISKFRFFNFYI